MSMSFAYLILWCVLFVHSKNNDQRVPKMCYIQCVSNFFHILLFYSMFELSYFVFKFDIQVFTNIYTKQILGHIFI